MNRLVIIDGHAILHRAYHALPPLTTSKGLIVNAVYGFTSMLLRVIETLKPTHLVVAFDTPEPTFRNKLFKDYQIQRPKADEEFISQIATVKNVVSEMGIPMFEKAGFEADDVIGTIAAKADTDEVVIVTGDRDMLQLVDGKTKIYMPVKGLSQSKLYGKDEVEEKYGIKPYQVVDYKALVGDASDNYPGVAGIGPKTAISLLHEYGSFEEIYNHLDDIKSSSIREKLINGKEGGVLSKKLATIVKDAPVNFELEKCKLASFDTPLVRWLFEEMEFRSLIPRLSGRNQKSEIKNQNELKEKREGKKIQQATLF